MIMIFHHCLWLLGRLAVARQPAERPASIEWPPARPAKPSTQISAGRSMLAGQPASLPARRVHSLPAACRPIVQPAGRPSSIGFKWLLLSSAGRHCTSLSFVVCSRSRCRPIRRQLEGLQLEGESGGQAAWDSNIIARSGALSWLRHRKRRHWRHSLISFICRITINPLLHSHLSSWAKFYKAQAPCLCTGRRRRRRAVLAATRASATNKPRSSAGRQNFRRLQALGSATNANNTNWPKVNTQAHFTDAHCHPARANSLKVDRVTPSPRQRAPGATWRPSPDAHQSAGSLRAPLKESANFD